jgi:pSer/pThr/pTyr-binding forkhead associated (FHA) protein
MVAYADVAHLTLVLQGREVRKFVLNSTVTTIGRAQDNDIVINNLALSRRHAQVERRGNRYEVSDLGSQNGVYVNSERVRGSRTLDNTDTITLGTYHFVFSDTVASDPDVESVRREKRPLPTAAEVTEAPRPREKEPEPEHVPLLVLKYNEVELQRFSLKGASCLIGRAKECEVQIPERRLSRKHCEIVREGDRFFALDLGSQNGTYVNRKRIRDRQELFHEDVLNFAEYSVLFLGDVAEYDGPDLVHARREAAQQRSGHSPGPRPGSGIAAEETAFPEAYSKSEGGYEPSIVGDDRQVHPSDMTDDPEESQAGRPPMAMMPPPGRRTPVATTTTTNASR